MDGARDSDDDAETTGPETGRRLVARLHGQKRLALRIAVSTLLFGRYLSFTYLNPLETPRMMVGADWTTYLVSPNYLRGSSWISFPIAQIPRYVAPVGTSLGRTDSLPVLTPIYRLLLTIFPHRPVQLVGIVLFLGVILTFVSITSILDKVRTDLSTGRREVATLALASVGVAAPFWVLQYNHPAMMQAWIIIWALGGALRRCPSALGGSIEQTDRRWSGTGPLCAAAAIQPYFLPMIVLVVFAPDIAHIRGEARFLATKVLAAAGLVGGIGLLLGYLGSGGKLGSDGFGNYAADLTTLFDAGNTSRFLVDIPTTPGEIGGFGYIGLGGLLLVAIAIVSARRSSRQRQATASTANGALRHLEARWLWAAVGISAIYAVLPDLRVSGHKIASVVAVTKHFESLTALFRVNGRFIWVALWMLLLVAMTITLRQKAKYAVGIAVLVAVVQFADVIPFPRLLRSSENVHYADARTVLMSEQADGARRLEVQPPVVIPGCYDLSIPFDQLGDTLLAASVLGIATSSGYMSREDPSADAAICKDQAASFQRGHFSNDVVYILSDTAIVPDGLGCRGITPGLLACRATPT